MTAGDGGRLRAVWPNAVSGDWLLLVIVSGGLVAVFQAALGLEWVPVQTGARLLFVALTVLAFVGVLRRMGGVQTVPAVPLALFSLSAVMPLALAWSDSGSMDSFLFMNGTASILMLFALVPIVVRPARLFKIFCVTAAAFGLLQIWMQDLLVPDPFIQQFGIAYQDFVNGRVRALSFFASAPRFAELLVFLAAYLQHALFRRQFQLWRLLSYGAVLVALYNTYSRSGYVLFLATMLAQLWFARVSGTRRRAWNLVDALLVLGTACGVLILLTMDRLPVEVAIFDATSWQARQLHWESVLSGLETEDLPALLFGTGRSAHFSRLSPEYFVVDNLFLAVFLYSGFFGLATFVWLVWAVLRRGALAVSVGGASRWHPVLAFSVALLVEGMFVDNHNTVFITQFAVLGMLTCDLLQARSVPPAPPVTVPDASSGDVTASAEVRPRHGRRGRPALPEGSGMNLHSSLRASTPGLPSLKVKPEGIFHGSK